MTGASDGLVGQAMRFGAVGVANTLIGMVIILGLAWAGVDPFLANATGYVIGTAFSFFANARWTFGARPGGATLLRFLLVIAVAYGVNFVVLAAALRMGWGDVGSQLPAMVCFTACNFAGQRWFTFRKGQGARQ